jgi:hypothetical protein
LCGQTRGHQKAGQQKGPESAVDDHVKLDDFGGGRVSGVAGRARVELGWVGWGISRGESGL